MSKFAKILVTIILVTIIVLFVFFMFFRIKDGARSAGIFDMLLFAALIGAVRAIWKSGNKDGKENEGMLQK